MKGTYYAISRPVNRHTSGNIVTTSVALIVLLLKRRDRQWDLHDVVGAGRKFA